MMAPIKPTFTDHTARLRIYAGEDADPSRYVIWYEGRDRLIVRKRGESSADLYLRVLEQVQEMRLAVRYGYWQGQELNFAHVYAGVKPSAADKRERMKEWCSARLYDLADHHSDGATRVAALGALAELYGLHPPVSFTLPTQEQIEAEIARRQVQ